MSITDTLSHNINRLLREYDISARELASRASIPQKTLNNIVTSRHACRISTLEQLSKTLFISPAAMITPHLPTNVLMSRRLSRFIDTYSKMNPEQREHIEELMAGMVQPESPQDAVESV